MEFFLVTDYPPCIGVGGQRDYLKMMEYFLVTD